MKFKTARLNFSVITNDDEQEVFETLNFKDTAETISFFNWPMTKEQAKFWCDKAVLGVKNKTDYIFIARKGVIPVGCIGLHINSEKKVETGYWVSENHQNHGFGTEMLHGIISFCVNNFSFSEVFATTTLDNQASQNLLLKNNFKFKEEKNIKLHNGEIRPSKIFILKL